MNILEEASKIVGGDREADYGDSNENLRRIANIFTALTMKECTIEDVAYMQIAVKFGRELHKHKRDNLVDACGYLELLNRVHDWMDDEPKKRLHLTENEDVLKDWMVVTPKDLRVISDLNQVGAENIYKHHCLSCGLTAINDDAELICPERCINIPMDVVKIASQI